MSKDYYKILEVDKNASPEEIKRSYRNLSKKYHPDVNNGSDEKFKEISNAYDVLSDSEKRESYDRFGSDGPQQGGGFDFNDIFSSFGFNPFGGQGQKQYRRGSDVKISVSVTILDILKGVNKKVKYKRNVQCTSCNGKGGSKVESCQSCSGSGMRVTRQQTPMGIFQTQSPCSSCNGQGKRIVDKCQPCNGQGLIVDEDTVSIDIPAGVSGGMTLQMRGKGSSSKDGNFGDLLIYINEEENPLYKRDENNIIYSKKINYIDLLTGLDTDVELVDGTKSKISIEKGTKCDKIYRIKGKGLPNINGGPSGDFYVELDIDVPILNNEQIEKIKSVII